MSRTTPLVEFHLDVAVLGDLFGLDVQSSGLRFTLSGRPYLFLIAKPRNPAHTFADGDVVYGHAKSVEGGVKLGVHRLGETWDVPEEPKVATMLGEPITMAELKRISADGP